MKVGAQGCAEADRHHNERPQFSRTNMNGYIELRVWVPKLIIDTLDAEVINRGGEGANVYRATVVQEVLGPWAEKKVHDANVVLQLTGSNPTGSAKAAA